MDVPLIKIFLTAVGIMFDQSEARTPVNPLMSVSQAFT